MVRTFLDGKKLPVYKRKGENCHYFTPVKKVLDLRIRLPLPLPNEFDDHKVDR